MQWRDGLASLIGLDYAIAKAELDRVVLDAEARRTFHALFGIVERAAK